MMARDVNFSHRPFTGSMKDPRTGSTLDYDVAQERNDPDESW